MKAAENKALMARTWHCFCISLHMRTDFSTASLSYGRPTPSPLAPQVEAAAPKTSNSSTEGSASSQPPNGFSFWDVLDVINPLQHIPGLNHVYRSITGDEIKPISKVAGGGLFGGIIGLASSALDAAVESFTGKDIAGHLVATAEDLFKATPSTSATTAVATNESTPDVVMQESTAPAHEELVRGDFNHSAETTLSLLDLNSSFVMADLHAGRWQNFSADIQRELMHLNSAPIETA